MRTSNGCWTCRLRCKKCDENHPVCDACAALCITCHNDQNSKPEWMDGSVKQEEMAEYVKREVKEKAHHPRGERAVHISGNHVSVAEASLSDLIEAPENPARDPAAPVCDLLKANSDVYNEAMEPSPEASTLQFQHAAHCVHSSKNGCESVAFERSDTVLFMFYIEKLLPFLFPFYNPSLIQGGKAWILEMMIRRPVVRQAVLCQSFYFSLAWGTAGGDAAWEEVLTQTQDAFGVLRQALQVIDGSHIAEHLHGAVRILASIMQLQRFEIAVLSFDNWQAHLNAALALFRQLLDSPGAVEPATPNSRFDVVMSRLGPSPWNSPTQGVQVPTAEQAAFRFSSTLVMFDDIIASTVLQEQPRLYEYHRSLLISSEGTEPPINLEAITGVENLVLLEIGEIAALDSWKQRRGAAGNLDVMELAHRALAIKESLRDHLIRLETGTDSAIDTPKTSRLLDIFTTCACQPPNASASQSSSVTHVWTHAALIYLSVVVSGWQPARVDVRYHVGRIVELLKQVSPLALLRTMVWPFCVAGCLAEPAQEAQLRGMVETLRPSAFGTVHKALQIMENVWRNMDAGDIAACDLATCFRSQGDLVLLV